MILYKGDAWEIPFSYTKESDVFDISNITEIKSCFKGTVSEVEVLLSSGEIVISSLLGGKGVINVPAAKTELIKKGIQDLVVIRTDNNNKPFTNVVEELLDIRDRPCG